MAAGRLAARACIVTGATKGIGEVVARRFVASDEAAHVTGATLPVDGGYTAA